MRFAAAIDENQPAIVEALRACGVSVTPIHRVGKGVPDLLCGYQGVNVLLEVKDPSKPPSKRVLTADEKKFHLHWRGQVAIVETFEQARAVIQQAVSGKERKH